MTTKIYFRPIIPLLLSMISGILLGAYFPGRSAAMAGVVLVCVFIVLWNIRQRNAIFIPPVIFLPITLSIMRIPMHGKLLALSIHPPLKAPIGKNLFYIQRRSVKTRDPFLFPERFV
jgi:hypothetical protein